MRRMPRSEEHTSELQSRQYLVCRFFIYSAAPEISPLSLHDALPFSAGAVASLAADVPFGHRLCVNIVVHGVASVACGPGGAVHVVGRIKRRPPTCTAPPGPHATDAKIGRAHV